jgi:hypothetical protein
MLGEMTPLLFSKATERPQDIPEISFHGLEIWKNLRSIANVVANPENGVYRQIGTDVIDYEPLNRGVGEAGHEDSDHAAQRRSNPTHVSHMQFRQQNRHVDNVLIEVVVGAVDELTAQAAPHNVGADDSVAFTGKTPSQKVEIAALSSQAVHADDDASITL